MTPESLVRVLEEFLADARGAVILEDGAVTFDLAQAKYSISGERNKCLLHLWSAERNVVRRVLDAEVKCEALSLTVQRMGQTRPSKVEICRERDRRTPSAKQAARVAYQELRRVLARLFPAFTVIQLSTAMDLERSFGPIYGDAALTFGILWLDACRQAHAGKFMIEGLKLFFRRRVFCTDARAHRPSASFCGEMAVV